LSIDFVKTAESIDITPSNMKVDVAGEKVYIINSATPSSSSVFPSPSASYISVRNPGNVSLSKLELQINVKVCFMTAGEINQQAIRELYPLRTMGGCFIKKPVEIDHLISQLKAELE
jgi:hypothetical protein